MVARAGVNMMAQVRLLHIGTYLWKQCYRYPSYYAFSMAQGE
jgi:hypothetical protein